MTIFKRTQKAFLLVLLAITCLTAAPAQVAPSLSDPIPVEREITIGRLSNGLRYYVRANKKPEKRAELRLVVKAGSVLEDDDQQGLAHFVEHMAFDGTAHFPKNEIIKFIESLGMRFGADLNAYTSFDETVYVLQVPTDKPEVIDKTLLVLEDWAHNVSFDTDQIDKERGVVMEEWRLRRGAGARTTDKLFPILLKGSRYADRIPIGKPEIIQNFKPDTLKKVVQIVREEDPNHPFMVGDARDVIGRVKDRSNFFPLNEMDMGMWWWYPLPLEKKARLDVLEGAEVSGLELVPPEFLTKANTHKPINGSRHSNGALKLFTFRAAG